ncbi:MAG: ABC transporter permease [Acidobacteriaceae bacterium]|nr:ABC transporter permease [Acidobacteriaceae bacterium]
MRLGELWRRIAFLLHRKEHLDAIGEEMRLHAELRARAIGAQSVHACDAAQAARRQFGNTTSFKEAAWHAWSFVSLENAWRDLTFGAHVLRANVGFTAMAVLTLALGIGATTAIFSVIDNVLLEPFPYAHQQRLYSLVLHDQASSEPGGRTVFPATEFLDYQQQNRVFEDVMGVAINRALWTTGGPPESVNAPLITANAFQFLGVPPLLGRAASAADASPGSAPVCVMSYSFWRSRFGGDAHVVGQSLTLDGTPRTVIGVMPPRFVFWSADVWIPVQLARGQAGFPQPWFYMLGRLRPGVTLKTADRQLQMLAERMAIKYRPDLYPSRFDLTLQSFADSAVGKFRRTLFTLVAAVGLLLVIACANVASLLLARVGGRRRELAVRTSLGAGWWRIVRQLFLESALLAVLGAAAGCAFAYGGLQVLMAVLPRDTFPDEAVIGLNVRVLAGTIAVTVATALFFGLIPMLGGLREDVNEALKSGGRQHSGFRRSQFRNLLVVAEVAISLVLLSAAGVMMRSFIQEREVQLGVRPQHLLTAEIFLTKGHRTVDEQARFRREFINAMQHVPGVLDVGTSTDFLPFGGAVTAFELPDGTHTEQWTGLVSMISPTLFHTLEVPLLRGRNLSETDIAGKHMVALVNQAFVKKFFPAQDALGQHVGIVTLAHLPQPIPQPWFDIVGVTGDFKNRGVRQPVMPEAFVPYSVSGLGGFSVFVRTAGDPEALGRTLEANALTLDASTMVRHTRTMQDALETEEYAKPRFGLEILTVFAALGVLLVSAGLYSVMSYTVSQRRREMGIRIALGATSADVQALVIGSGMRFVVLGVVVGVIASFAALRLIQNQIWGVSTHDPVTLIGVTGILIVVGVAACYAPALTATHADPAETLRAE